MKYLIADTVVETSPKTKYVEELFAPFRTDDSATAALAVNTARADAEREALKGGGVSLALGESLHICRVLSEYLINNGIGISFHCSALDIKDKGAVLFTAVSGVGKSTHARLWRENFQDAHTINDDKPFIVKRNDGYYVCGSPWMGKHKLGDNSSAKIKAICFLKQAKTNSIDIYPSALALPKILDQTLRFSEKQMTLRLFSFLDGFMKEVDKYLLKCNMENEAAVVARTKIFEDI